jgi:hypothetical protein
MNLSGKINAIRYALTINILKREKLTTELEYITAEREYPLLSPTAITSKMPMKVCPSL